MAKGWNIITSRPNPKGGPALQGRFLVTVSDKATAIQMVQQHLPDAEVTADSEASEGIIAEYRVKPGTIFALVEGA